MCGFFHYMYMYVCVCARARAKKSLHIGKNSPATNCVCARTHAKKTNSPSIVFFDQIDAYMRAYARKIVYILFLLLFFAFGILRHAHIPNLFIRARRLRFLSSDGNLLPCILAASARSAAACSLCRLAVFSSCVPALIVPALPILTNTRRGGPSPHVFPARFPQKISSLDLN